MIRFHALLYLSIYLAGSVLIFTYRAYTTYRCGDAGTATSSKAGEGRREYFQSDPVVTDQIDR